MKPPLTYITLEGTKACHIGMSLMAVAIIIISAGAISRAIYLIDVLTLREHTLSTPGKSGTTLQNKKILKNTKITFFYEGHF
jgi:hypothetical protein